MTKSLIDPQKILHVHPETLMRLLESGRARRREDGVPFIREKDHAFGGMALQISDKVAPNGV
jgi:hypothetical protein